MPVRTEWLALSASALVIGVTALFFGARLTPRPTGDGSILRLASADPDLWTAAALVLFVAAVGMLFGISCMAPLVRRRGFALGISAMGFIAFASVVLAGFSMQLVLLRGLSLEGGVGADTMVAAMEDPLQQLLLKSGFAAFYLGELLGAWALWLAATTPRWVPLAFVAHLLAVLVGVRLDVPGLTDAAALLMVAGFAGVAVSANRADVAARQGTPTLFRA